METPTTAVQQYKQQQVIAAVAAQSVARVWSQVGPDFDAGWARVRSVAADRLQLGRAAAVHAAVPYTSAVLAETGQIGGAVGTVVPAVLLASAPDGAAVLDTLDSAPIRAKQAVARGASVAEANAAVKSWLTGVSLTMLADTRRDVYQADIVARPAVTGYVRMLNPPSCSRCAILAGKRFLWNEGFQRHPRCDCQHIPASEQVAGDFTTDPYEYFKSLDEKTQAQYFGKYQAEAIRDGADIFQVVNTRNRGVAVVGAPGSRARMVRYGGREKPTLATLYKSDRNRQFVIENLQHHGYITGAQNPNGNIRGNDPLARILDRGRGQGFTNATGTRTGTARAARYDAAVTGTRDLLNRSTMTAAERRLYDAHYRSQWADAGYRPNSVGANSADRGLGLRPITQVEATAARERLAQEVLIASDVNTPESVRELGRLMGLPF